MSINDIFNKICLYSTVLGYGKETDKGNLLECSGVSLYNNVNEVQDDSVRYLLLDVNIVSKGETVGHYRGSYVFPKGSSGVFDGLDFAALKEFVEGILSIASFDFSFDASDACSFGILSNIVNFGENLGKMSDKTNLCVK